MKPLYRPLAGIKEAEQALATFPDVSGIVVTEVKLPFTQSSVGPHNCPSAPTIDDELVAELEKIIAGAPPRMPDEPQAHCAPAVLLDQTSLAQSAGWNPQLERVDLPPAFPLPADMSPYEVRDSLNIASMPPVEARPTQEEVERSAAWDRMIADLPSAQVLTDHGCKLANYIAKQERRRNWTLTQSRRTDARAADDGSAE